MLSVVAGWLQGRAAEPYDWQSFVSFCERHLLAGYCYSRSRQLGQNLPDWVQARWGTLLFRQALDNQRRMQFLDRLSERLDCPWILMKGPYLAERFYGGLQFRHLADFDVLIHGPDLERVSGIFSDLGLECATRYWLPQSWSLAFLHALDWKGETPVDLHFRLRALPFLKIDMERFFQNHQVWNWRGREYRVPGDNDCLLVHLLGLQDDLGRRDWKLKSMVDIYLMLSQLDLSMDWSEFFAERRREGLETVSRSLLSTVLSRLQAKAQFPRLSRALAQGGTRVHVPDFERFSALQARLWWSRVFDAPWPLALGWWALSLPVRWYAHR